MPLRLRPRRPRRPTVGFIEPCQPVGAAKPRDERGLTVFDLLRHGSRIKSEAVLFAFDLLGDDGTYIVEFRTEGKSLAISIPRTDTAVIRRFQERMPYGLIVPPPPGKK